MSRKIKFNITDASAGAAFTVKVITRADQAELAGIEEDGSIKVRLTSSPTEGGVNEELIDFLSQLLKVEPNQLEIISGQSSRVKLVTVEGISPTTLEERLNQ